MSSNIDAVRAYMSSYAAGDHEGVDALLADDVTWIVHGFGRFDGRSAYVAEMKRGEAAGQPLIVADRFVEQGDIVCVTGRVQAPMADGSHVDLVFSDVFTFRDGLMAVVESYVVPLGPPSG